LSGRPVFVRFIKDPTKGTTSDTIYYKAGADVKSYMHVEPHFRCAISHSKSSIKASYTQKTTSTCILLLSSISLPTDLWIPSSDRVQPQLCKTQYALGYFRNFKKNIYETSVEVYYKDMQHQIEYAPGALLKILSMTTWTINFVFGKGGVWRGVFVKKAKGRFNGWIGYTLHGRNGIRCA